MQPMPGLVPGMIGITPPDSHPEHREEDHMSWKPEVQTDNTDKWYPNGLAFATREEALNNAFDLSCRWFAVREWRAVESAEPVNYSYVDRKLERVS